MRLDNWELNLYEVLHKYEGKSFQYGTCDCAHFGGEIIKAVTGKYILPLFDKKYDSLRTSIKWLKDNNYDNTVQAISMVTGITHTSALKTTYGDLIAYYSSDYKEFALGANMGTMGYFLGESRNFMIVPIELCEFGWRL